MNETAVILEDQANTKGSPIEPAPGLIELMGVRVAFEGLVALDIDELKLGRGTIGLLGPNGAGKSTMLRTILGFRKPESGSVRVFGLDVSRDYLAIRQRIGYVPENDVTSPHHSGVAFVSHCGELVGMRRTDALQAAHQALNFVGLGDQRYRKMATYSLGMRQRAKLAQALVHDPELIFLDEPTNGLDPKARLEMLELIRLIAKKRGVTVVLSTHLLPDVEAICNEVVVLSKGQVCKRGLLKDLLKQTSSRFEVGFTGQEEPFRAALTRRDILCHPGPDGRLIVEAQKDCSTREIVEAINEAGSRLRHLAPLRQTLEEIFLQAVKES